MKSLKRRDFLKGVVAASAVGVAPFNILKAGPSPNSKLNIAGIGIGAQGSGNLSYLTRSNNVIALCDVDQERFGKCITNKKELHGIRLWNDYRVMFDKIGKDIDAVCIATPEHNHYTISMHAIRNGKHVYCQKPLCHTVNEVRLLTEEARKYPKVITQMGHQGHSSRSSAMLRDWGLADSVGPIRQVNAYSRKNYWTDKPLVKGCVIPKTLDWDLYLNRAEMIPFSTSYMNREWIRYSHFSGAVGDMAAHIFDPAYYALDLRIPLSVRAEVNTPAYPGSLPRSGVIT
ncbi:MAG: Gfo/Idh/MocA family protein, partial [Planctomycetota bacterium]